MLPPPAVLACMWAGLWWLPSLLLERGAEDPSWNFRNIKIGRRKRGSYFLSSSTQRGSFSKIPAERLASVWLGMHHGHASCCDYSIAVIAGLLRFLLPVPPLVMTGLGR